MKIGDWTLKSDSNELIQGDKTIKLEAQCSMVLEYLAQNAGEVVTNDSLLDKVWGRHSVSVQSIPVVISKLRTILGDDTKNPSYIETIHKRGYRLIAPVGKEEEKSTTPNSQTPAKSSSPSFIKFSLVSLVLILLFWFSDGAFGPKAVPQTLYVADVENLTNNEAYNAVAAGASEVLTSRLVGPKGLSIVRLRRHLGEIQWVAPGLSEEEQRPYPLLTSSIIAGVDGPGVYMQLEDGEDHQIVWTYQFSLKAGEFPSLYRNAAQQLLAHYNINNSRDKELYTSTIAGVEEIYLRANYLWGLRGRENNLPAHDLATQALNMDPTYTPAFALLAEIYTRYDGEYLNLGTVDTVTLARQYLEQAKTLDPDHPSVLLASASQAITLDWRPDLALIQAKRAVELAPQNGMAHRILSTSYYLLGQLEENRAELGVALRLESSSPPVRLEAILELFAREKYSDIIELSKTIPIEFLGSYRIYIALSYAELGNHKQAIATFINLFNYENSDLKNPDHPLTLVEDGKVKDAYNQLLKHLMATSLNNNQQFFAAILSLYNGEKSTAPHQLAKITFSRDTNALNAIHMWPIFYGFKDHPIMQDTLKRIGVAPYAKCVHRVCKQD